MSDTPENASPEQPRRLRRRRVVLLWALGLTVLLLLGIIVSQQLWLWTVIRPDNASDTLGLYALSTLNFVAFVVFSFIFVRNLLKLRRERPQPPAAPERNTPPLTFFLFTHLSPPPPTPPSPLSP